MRLGGLAVKGFVGLLFFGKFGKFQAWLVVATWVFLPLSACGVTSLFASGCVGAPFGFPLYSPVLVPHSFVLVEALWRDCVQLLDPEDIYKLIHSFIYINSFIYIYMPNQMTIDLLYECLCKNLLFLYSTNIRNVLNGLPCKQMGH